MPRSPFKKRSKIEQVSDRAELAGDGLREAAATLHDRADSLLSEIDAISPPLPEKRRRPVLVVLVIGGIAAVVYAVRKATGSPADELPSPDVTPTAPAGPTDDRLNDPALKAKVESELFADEEVEAPKSDVLIDVADGVVTLRGSVESEERAVELVAVAEEIDGVRRVESELAGASG
ncbi:MAG TPA: BON domain-containing protein [Solirubrobacterales bacterium]|nr:BON domain-containing protein [Solirubrobacterales bacterium]